MSDHHHQNDHHHDLAHQHHMDETDVFGFWIYIMTDCILFAALFAGYAVLHNNTFGHPGLKQLTSLPYVFGETMALLASSFTYGMSILSMYNKNKARVIFWLGVTFLFGLIFVGMEVREFVHLYMEGHSWHVSAALTSFFTLVGTHGCHVSFGLLWMLVMMVQLCYFDLSHAMVRRLTYLGLFWAFLDIVWIFVFTIVYLMGVI
jgi:cytochrome o ubiquinol oxidase subunit 3